MHISHTKFDNGIWMNQSIDDHCGEVGNMAAEFAEQFGASEWARLCGLWHDIGKYANAFQQHIKAASGQDATIHDPGKVPHAIAGAIYASERLRENGCYLPISYCICGHHAGLPDYEGGQSSTLKHHLSEKEQLEEIRLSICPADIPILTPPHVICDDKYRPMSWHLWIRMLYSCLVDADYLDTERFMNPTQYKMRQGFDTMDVLYNRLQQYLHRLAQSERTPINDIRSNIQSLCKQAGQQERGIYTLTVPTGGGKTIASMVWAMEQAKRHGAAHIIIAIPYTSIIAQTAQTLRGIFGEHNVVEHHSNTDFDKISDDRRRGQAMMATENWDAPIIVTTNVQLFESLYANRSSRCRKLHNLVGSILILDEVQMLTPTHLRPIVDVLHSLHSCFNVSILMTTATRPALSDDITYGHEKLSGLLAHEIVDECHTLFERMRRTSISFIDKPYTHEKIAQELAQHKQVLCVVNTRKDASTIYDMMPQDEVPTIHLSRSMCQEHIMHELDKVRQLLQAEQPVRVISTQLIEAGVDIDFPTVYRAMAGLDSIAQSAGRCNREGRRKRGQVFVFSIEGQRLQGLVGKGASTSAELLAMGHTDFLSPETTEEYFRLFYHKVNNLDTTNLCDKLYRPTPQFATAAADFHLINEDTITVYVPYKDGENLIRRLLEGEYSASLLRRLQRYSVSIYATKDQDNLLKSIGAIQIGEQVYALTDGSCYDEHKGLTPDNPYIENELII